MIHGKWMKWLIYSITCHWIQRVLTQHELVPHDSSFLSFSRWDDQFLAITSTNSGLSYKINLISIFTGAGAVLGPLGKLPHLTLAMLDLLSNWDTMFFFASLIDLQTASSA